ncbi:MAG: hypothetical protein OXC30_06750 [Alphaproteobacteria bacterium]|nr:hypothetical protein [Alphaproteobacteria bacterium]
MIHFFFIFSVFIFSVYTHAAAAHLSWPLDRVETMQCDEDFSCAHHTYLADGFMNYCLRSNIKRLRYPTETTLQMFIQHNKNPLRAEEKHPGTTSLQLLQVAQDYLKGRPCVEIPAFQEGARFMFSSKLKKISEKCPALVELSDLQNSESMPGHLANARFVVMADCIMRENFLSLGIMLHESVLLNAVAFIGERVCAGPVKLKFLNPDMKALLDKVEIVTKAWNLSAPGFANASQLLPPAVVHNASGVSKSSIFYAMQGAVGGAKLSIAPVVNWQEHQKKLRKEHAIEAQKAKERDLYYQPDHLPLLSSDVCPEPLACSCIKQFLDGRGGQCAISDLDDYENYDMRMWLHKTQGEANHLTRYPFLHNPCLFYEDIKRAMYCVIGVLAWGKSQTPLGAVSCMNWGAQGPYECPDMKQIIESWSAISPPTSFCENILFLMQNRKILGSFGCNMSFLDRCLLWLPGPLKQGAPGVERVADLYQDVFYKTVLYMLELRDVKHGNQAAFDIMEDFKKSALFVESDALQWMCRLTEFVMITETWLGKEVSFEGSVFGMGAYLNDRLEHIQFIPGYMGLNTESIEHLINSVAPTRRTLNKKRYGFKSGMHRDLLAIKVMSFPKTYTISSVPFQKTRAAVCALKLLFGVRQEDVERVVAVMDQVQEIPSEIYHENLSTERLNKFLTNNGAVAMQDVQMLDVARMSVERILLKQKITWFNDQMMDYRFYRELFKGDVKITTEHLKRAQAVIAREGSAMTFQNVCPFIKDQEDVDYSPPEKAGEYGDVHRNIVHNQEQNPYLLALDAYMHQYLTSEWLPEHMMLLETENVLKEKEVQLEEAERTKSVYVQRIKDPVDMRDDVVLTTHDTIGLLSKAQHMDEFTEQEKCTIEDLREEYQALAASAAVKRAEHERKKSVLNLFITKMNSASVGCWAQQPVNMGLLLLKAIGVPNIELAVTPLEAQQIVSSVINLRPMKRSTDVYDVSLQGYLQYF